MRSLPSSSGVGDVDPEPPAPGDATVWAVPPNTAYLIAHMARRTGGGQQCVATVCGQVFAAVAILDREPQVVPVCRECRRATSTVR